MTTIYYIDSSARVNGSQTRTLGKELVSQLQAKHSAEVTYRDVSQGLTFLTPDAIDGLYIPNSAKTEAQLEALALSDQVVRELIAADIVVIGAPIYNFGPTASLKAWVDLVARKDLTFRYTERGPEGLLSGKQAFVVITSGGVPVGSPVDHLSPWIRTFLGFIGITDVTILAADQLNFRADVTLPRVREQIAELGSNQLPAARPLESAVAL